MFKEKFYTVPEKPMTSDEANERMYQMIRERARQDAEFRANHGKNASNSNYPKKK